MKKIFTKQLFPIAAVLITMLVIGFGISARSAQADLTLLPGNFSAITHTVTYNADAHGAIFGTTPQTVSFGGDTTYVLAVPNPGYVFVRWSDGVTTTARNHTDVVADTTVSAIFALDVPSVNTNNNVGATLPATYTLTYSAQGNHGNILGANPQTISLGANGTSVTAVAKPNYTFAGWSDGVTSATRTDTNVASNINVTALFDYEALTGNDIYLVTYSVPSGRGYIQGSSSQFIAEGNDGSTVKAIPNSGYHFTKWSDNITTATRRETDVSEDLELTASFASNSSSGGSNSGSQSVNQILGSGVCPADLTITQNLKSGAHNGEYLKYNGGIVTQVHILQKQINRILAASYNQAAGPVDGRFGPLTKLGVQRLQLALVDNLNANLGPKGADGVVGAFTKAAINNSCGGM